MNFIAKEFATLSGSEVYEILKSRMEVFMLEQKILCLDMDDVDYKSHHIFLEDDGRVVAYMRAFFTDSDTLTIGRVLTLTHGKGLGRALMESGLSYIKENLNPKKITLHSQSHAKGFYEKFGFSVVGDEFLEEGVPHISMELNV